MTLSLDLQKTAKKLYKCGYFHSFELSPSVLHCEHHRWMFNFYHTGLATVAWPEVYETLALTYPDYQHLRKVERVAWPHHFRQYTDNPDFCLRLALSYVF